MTPEQLVKINKILENLISKHASMREFAREIREDVADVIRWKSGKRAISARAVISICRIYPTIKPHELNPVLFPPDLRFVFKK